MPKDWLAIFTFKVTVRAHGIKIRTVSIISIELLILLQPNLVWLYIIISQNVLWKDWIVCSKSRFKTSLTNKTGLLCSSGFKTSAFFVCFCFFLSLSIFLQLNLSVWCTVNNCSQSGHMPTYIIMRHIVGGILPQGSKACLVLLFLVLFYFFLVCARERDTESHFWVAEKIMWV